MIFGDGPLFEVLFVNSMLACVRLMCFYIGTAQVKKVHGWTKLDLQGGTGFNLLRVQFLDPCKKKRVSKRVRKWLRLKSKAVPPGGSSFGPFLTPFIVANFVEAFISS